MIFFYLIIPLALLTLGVGCQKQPTSIIPSPTDTTAQGEFNGDRIYSPGDVVKSLVSPNSEWVATTIQGDDMVFRLAVEGPGGVNHVFPNHALPISFSPDGQYLLFTQSETGIPVQSVYVVQLSPSTISKSFRLIYNGPSADKITFNDMVILPVPSSVKWGEGVVTLTVQLPNFTGDYVVAIKDAVPLEMAI